MWLPLHACGTCASLNVFAGDEALAQPFSSFPLAALGEKALIDWRHFAFANNWKILGRRTKQTVGADE